MGAIGTSGWDHRQDAIADALARWRADAGSATLVQDAANAVVRFTRGGVPLYLRATPASHRTRDQIEAELDFVRFLASGGLRVATPVPSSDGHLIETLAGDTAGDERHLCVFVEAPGAPFRYDGARLDLAHFRRRGALLGRLHALSRRYAPSGPRRHAWQDDPLWRGAAGRVPPTDARFWREHDEVVRRLRALPADDGTLGLVHGDFGVTNYRVAGGELTLFDFDDCCYHWLAYDVAVSVYPYGERPERGALLRATVEGYRSAAPLDDRWVGAIGTLCRLRVLYMYLVRHPAPGATPDPELARWLEAKRRRMTDPVEWGVARDA